MTRLLSDDEPVAVTIPEPQVRIDEDEDDRVVVHANGIVVDIVANEDGTVYIETYAYDGRGHQAVVEDAFIDRYRNRHPSVRVRLAEVPGVTQARANQQDYAGGNR